MANQVVITKLLDGPRHAIFHVFLASDGASGEVVDLVVVNPADLTPGFSAKPSLTVEDITHSFSGFSGKFEFDSLVDTPVWVVSEQSHGPVCFRDVGGLKDRSNPLDGSGKLLFSTVGFSASGDMGSFIIKVRKD